MIATVSGFENLAEKIGMEGATVAQEKASNVNYSLSKMEAPLLRQMA